MERIRGISSVDTVFAAWLNRAVEEEDFELIFMGFVCLVIVAFSWVY